MVFLLFFIWIIWNLTSFVYGSWVLLNVLVLIKEFNIRDPQLRSMYLKRDGASLIKNTIILIINFILLIIFSEWFYPLYHS